MADGILGLGSTGSLDLSSELIDKLKTAESASTLDVITADIEETEAEVATLEEIETMVSELLDLVANFDLYTTDTNVFEEITASTSGTSVSFNAADTSGLSPGTISVTVEQLSQKDVFQSNIISDITEEIGTGTLSVSIAGETYDFSTDGKTYEDLAEEMSYYTALDVALEQVSDDKYRMVIKSSESGEANAITISQTTIDLGFEVSENHVLSAQNMKSTVDGISYDLSSNTIAMENGLSITAVEKGDSSITMARDTSTISETIEEVVAKYNELVDLIDANIYGDEDEAAVISDSSTLKSMMTGIKEILFDSYGLNDEENLFAYGISLDGDGYIEVDSTALVTAISDNYDDIKELFVGYAEKEGIGTRLKTYLDSLDSSDGLLTTYSDKLNDSIDTLNDDYDDASDTLDDKYQSMATQFAAYTVLITSMQNSFSALELIIADTTD